jgi:hypothetical protein
MVDRLMLFGEWCHARHTIEYEELPDWFILFDVLELTTQRFWTSQRRNLLAGELGLHPPPEVFRGHLKFQQVPALIGASTLGAARMEGLYFRREADECLTARAKVVSSEFKQQIEAHWSRRTLMLNRLRVSQPSQLSDRVRG